MQQTAKSGEYSSCSVGYLAFGQIIQHCLSLMSKRFIVILNPCIVRDQLLPVCDVLNPLKASKRTGSILYYLCGPAGGIQNPLNFENMEESSTKLYLVRDFDIIFSVSVLFPSSTRKIVDLFSRRTHILMSHRL